MAKILILKTLLFITCSVHSYAALASFDVLRVGNSYTSQASGHFNGFINAANTNHSASITVQYRTAGGRNLYDAARNNGVMVDVASGNYEHIVLQEQSLTSALGYWSLSLNSSQNFFRKYENNFGNLRDDERVNSNQIYHSVYRAFNDNDYDTTLGFYDQISNNSASSHIHTFQTWGRKDSVAQGISELGSQATHLAYNIHMADDITAEGILNGLNVSTSRAGEAFNVVADDEGDFTVAGNNFNLYSGDGSHASSAGYFLSEAVIMQGILDVECPGMLVSELGYTGGLNTALANELLATADSFSTVSVPEPSSMSLFGLCFVGFILRRKR